MKRDIKEILLIVCAAVIGILQLTLIILRATNVILIHWALVFLPVMIPVGILIGLALVVITIVLIILPRCYTAMEEKENVGDEDKRP